MSQLFNNLVITLIKIIFLKYVIQKKNYFVYFSRYCKTKREKLHLISQKISINGENETVYEINTHKNLIYKKNFDTER